MIKLRLFALLLAVVPALGLAAGGGPLEHAGTDLNDRASLQRGAGLFMNYCAGCHALSLHRYSRIASDLDLPPELVEQHLMPANAKIGENINTGISAGDGNAWFGKAPPDLSLTARARLGGPDWIYSYLKGFYVDESRPLGWNNTLFPNASMPNPLWEMQGLQRPVHGEVDDSGEPVVAHLELGTPGSQRKHHKNQPARPHKNHTATPLKIPASPQCRQRLRRLTPRRPHHRGTVQRDQ